RRRKAWQFSNEKDAFPAVIWLLNRIAHALRQVKHEQEYYHKDTKFYEYDRLMADKSGSVSELKPDGVGLHGTLRSDEKVPWSRCETAIEVKDTWPALFRQAATYARCLFITHEGRAFVVVIGFNHKECAFRFLVFTRSGVISSPSMEVNSAKGFTGIVKNAVGLLSAPDAVAFGLNTVQNGSYFHFGTSTYRLDKQVCNRRTMIGRATIVSVLARCPQPGHSDANPQHASATPTSPETGPSASSRWEQSRQAPHSELTEDSSDPSSHSNSSPPDDPQTGPWDVLDPSTDVVNEPDPLPVDTSSWPDKIIVKASWLPEGRQNIEKDVFEGCEGLHGLPHILHSTKIPGKFYSTKEIFPENLSWSSALDPHINLTPPKPIFRVLVLQVVKTVGQSLETCESPYRLTRVILSAMLGHLVLFQRGWLLRDISSGNVLALSQPERRDSVTLSPTEGHDFELEVPEEFQDCFGICPDADQAIRWQEARQVMDERSGTYQFLSQATLEAWFNGAQKMHTPVDDLESFMWVLVWVGLKGFSDNNLDVKPVINAMLKGLGKRYILRGWCAKRNFSEPVHLLRPLIHHWRAIIDTHAYPILNLLGAHPDNPTREQDKILLHEIKQLSLAMYKAYLESGFKYLEGLQALGLDKVVWEHELTDDQKELASELFGFLG
ncbi:hypothetical protein FRB99_003528, partial [Tulasnella sp. 403]